MLYINKIPGRFLKDRAKLLTEPLCKIINLSFSSKFPLMWRAAKVKPLYKKGKNTEPKIYRPISWLSILSKIILLDKMKNLVYFLSGFSFTDTDDSQDSKGREGTIFYSTLTLPPAHKHWDIYLQLCMWDDYHVFLIATLVFTRLLLDEIYHLIELPFDWLIDDAMFVCLLDELILDFCCSDFDIGNQWIWTCIDYHPCITSKPTNQVC